MSRHTGHCGLVYTYALSLYCCVAPIGSHKRPKQKRRKITSLSAVGGPRRVAFIFARERQGRYNEREVSSEKGDKKGSEAWIISAGRYLRAAGARTA